MYNRLSQSEPVPPPEPPLDIPFRVERPPPRRQSRRKSSKRLTSIDLASQTYEDPPPPSAIRKYRESRTRSLHSDAVEPLLYEAFPDHPVVSSREPPQTSNRAPEAEVRRPPLATVREMGLSPLQSFTSLPSSRTDSFLGRAFAAQSDVSYSTDNDTAGATSNQSHRSQVRLTVGPEPVPNSTRHPVTRKPVRYSAPAVPPAIFMDARIQEASVPSVQSEVSASQVAGPSMPPPHRRHTAEWDRVARDNTTRELPALAQSRPYVPRRDQIVLPAPLAPSSSGNSTVPHPPGTYQDAFAHAGVADTRHTSFNVWVHPANTDSSLPRAPYVVQVREPAPLRRSKHGNMRHYSHTFVQQPPPPSSTPHAPDRRNGRRQSAPLHDSLTPEAALGTNVGRLRRS